MLEDVPDDLKGKDDIKGEASLKGHLKNGTEDKSGSQAYVPPHLQAAARLDPPAGVGRDLVAALVRDLRIEHQD